MKSTLGLFAILAIIGLGQAHQFPDFGKGPLHEDFQDILDLIPVDKIVEITVDYLLNDEEVQDYIEEFQNSTIIDDLAVGLTAIPEIFNFLDYLRKEGIGSTYHVANSLNNAFEIKELISPNFQVHPLKKRTGGLRGLYEDIRKQLDSDAFISIYVNKLKTSEVFVNFTNEIKSDNFQQMVNKVCEIKAFQYIRSRLEVSEVNLKIQEDIMYLLFGINVPSLPKKNLMEEIMNFVELLPMEKLLDVVIKYINEDEKVQQGALFMFESEFHDLLRALEATKEYQAFVIYIEKTGFPIIDSIKAFHRAIGMEDYVPPKIASFLKSLSKPQKIGDGMEGMLKDLHDLLPLDKIDALYEEKMKTSKVFVDFIKKITSRKMKKIVNGLIAHKAYKEFITKTKEKGLDIEGMSSFNNRIIGLKSLC